MKELLLTAAQREALDRLVNAGGVAFVNQKRNGFDQFRACDALALLIARLAEVEQGELRLSALGRLLTGHKISAEVLQHAVAACATERN